MKSYLLHILLLLSLVQTAFSQEDVVLPLDLPVRNSLKFNRHILNPTFSFVREQNKYLSFTNKREWAQFEGAPETYLFGYSGRFRENIGAGLTLFQENYGVISTFGGMANFAYNVRFGRESNLTFGMNLGLYGSGIYNSKVITNFDDPALNNAAQGLVLTVNPGINYGTGFLDFGASINNLVAYNINASEMIEENPAQGLQVHAMYTGYFNTRGFFDETKFSGLVRSEFQKDQTIISGLMMVTVPLGFWGQVGYNTLYGFSAGAGINITSRIALEYNYEKALGGLADLGNAHDITIAYRFKNRERYTYSGDDEEEALLIQTQKKPKTAAKKKKTDPRKTKTASTTNKAATGAAVAVEKDTKSDKEEKVSTDAEKLKAEEEAKTLADAEKRKAEEAAAALAAAEKLKAEEEAKARAEAQKLQAEQKAQELAAAQKLKAEQEAQALAAAEKLKAEEEAKALAETQRLKAEQEAQRLAEAQRLKAEQEALALAAAEKAKAEEEARKLAEAEKLKAEQEAQALALAEAERLKAEEEAKALAEAEKLKAAEKEAIKGGIVPTDETSKLMNDITRETLESKKEQEELLDKLAEKVAVKQKDLEDLKEENDLSEQGIVSAPKAFKSVSAENRELEELTSEIDDVIKAQNDKIRRLDRLYNERKSDVSDDEDLTNRFYKQKIEDLKSEQLKAIQLKQSSLARIEQLKEDIQVEMKRRIKRARYDNEDDRYEKDRSALNRIKQNTPVSSQAYIASDFDTGEKLNNIQILKGVQKVESGYYLVVAVHSDVKKRDEFLKKAVAAGESNIDFFFDVNTSKYYIYYEKHSNIGQAQSAMNSKGSKPYNSNMSMVKIEN